MFFFRKIAFIGTTLYLFLLMTLNSAMAQNNPNRPSQGNPNRPETGNLEEQLVSVAEASLRLEHDIIVNGNPEAARRRNPNAVRARAANIQRRLDRGRGLHSFLRGRKVGFRDFQTKLEVIDFRVSGDEAVLDAVEYTSLFYDLSMMAEGSPEQSEEIVEHRFTFNLQADEWELVSDEVVNGPGSTQGSAEEVITPLQETPDVAPSDPLAPPTSVQSNALPSDLSVTSSIQSDELKVFDHTQLDGELKNFPTLLAQTSPNRQAIVQYAYYYALTPNKDYPNFEEAGVRGGDCTNFISQAMRAGGWPDAKGWYRNRTSWWSVVSPFPPTQSWTWINADYFFSFIQSSSRVRTTDRVANLIPGDVISVDFDPQNNNGMDHTMLVSRKSNDGNIYLAYHTNNTLDKSFYQFYNETAANTSNQARYYAWSLSSRF